MLKFVVKETNTGFKFDLTGSNGKTIGRSEVYTTKAACLKGVESVKNNVVDANFEDQTKTGFETVTNPKFEMYLDKSDAYRFRLKSRNGQNILASDSYEDKKLCLATIQEIRNNVSKAKVDA
ncbi:MAG: YegP family protein [Erysipelothrix sp.]|nr:YegP family protein [Erysipelothrix sp.]